MTARPAPPSVRPTAPAPLGTGTDRPHEPPLAAATRPGAPLRRGLADARLRPGLEVLWRGQGELQLGSDPRFAVRVDGLDPAETRWLGAGGSRRLAPTAVRYGVTPERVAELLTLLHDAGALVTSAPADAAARTATGPGGGEADLPALAAVHPRGWGARVLSRRAARTVAVLGLGRTGAGVATALAAAGVGTLLLGDAHPVQTTDVGLGAYRLRDVGIPRQDAVAQAVSETCPTVRVRPTGGEHLAGADTVVLVEPRAPDAARAARLVASDVPHLSVVTLEAGVCVGPYVHPGRGPCLRCVELHRRDADPRWPTMAVQLRQSAARAEETSTAAVAAGLAAAQVLALLDGLPVRTLDASLEVLAPDAVPRVRGWQPHASCGCQGMGDAR